MLTKLSIKDCKSGTALEQCYSGEFLEKSWQPLMEQTGEQADDYKQEQQPASETKQHQRMCPDGHGRRKRRLDRSRQVRSRRTPPLARRYGDADRDHFLEQFRRRFR